METKMYKIMNILHTHTHTCSVLNIEKVKINKTSKEEIVKNKIGIIDVKDVNNLKYIKVYENQAKEVSL